MAWAGGEQDGGVMILATPGREEMVAGEAAQRCLGLEPRGSKQGRLCGRAGPTASRLTLDLKKERAFNPWRLKQRK